MVWQPWAFAAGGQQAWDWRAVCSGFSPSLLQRTQRSPKAFAFEMRLVPSDWHYVIVVTAATQGLLMTLPGLLCLTRGEAWPALLHFILSSFKHADKMKELQGAQPTPSTSLFQSTPCPSCFNYITAICPSFHPPLKLSSFFFFDVFQSKLEASVHLICKNFSMHIVTWSSMFAFST